MNSEKLHRLEMLGHLLLPEQVYVAAFLAELHHIIVSESNGYCWVNQQGYPSDIYDELAGHELSERLSALLNTPASSFREAIRHTLSEPAPFIDSSRQHPVHTKLKKLYQKTFLQCGYRHTLFIPVFVTQTYPCGYLLLNRFDSEPPFAQEEIDLLCEAKALFREGLLQTSKQEHKTTTGWRNGLVIVNERAEMLQCCPAGINLLSLAVQQRTKQLERTQFLDIRVLPGIQLLINTLLSGAREQNQDGLTVHSIWGEFRISGFPIVDGKGQRAPQVYLNISWQVPFPLKLFHNINHLNLTPRQEMIALLYAAGEPTKTIASSLGLSLYTVKEHIHNIFDKLQIHSRAELIEVIVCQETAEDYDQLKQRQLNRTERASMNIGRA